MKMLPKISIVTPSLNQGQFIERTILSVLNQNYLNIEYLVIDGGSSDGTIDILKKYEGRLIWESKMDKGQSYAINKGIKMCTGNIIAYLNSDDTYKLGAVATVVETFLRYPEIDLVYGDCSIINDNDKNIGVFRGIPTNFIRMLCTTRACIPQLTAFWRTEVIKKVGYFDESLHHAMDTDFYIRVLKKHKSLYIPIDYANHRWHPVSKSSIEKENCSNKFREDRIKILRKHRLQYLGFFYIRYWLLLKIKRRIFGQKPILKRDRGCIRFFKESM